MLTISSPRHILIALSLCASCAMIHAQNLLPNPGLEDGESQWGIFVPEESEGKGCEFLISTDSPHAGQYSAELKSAEVARFAIGPKKLDGDVIRPGDRVRLCFWIRASQDLYSKGKPPFIVRMFFLGQDGKQLPTNEAVFIGLNGKTTIQSPDKGLDLSGYPEELPTTWTKVESIFEVPADSGAHRLGPPEFFAQQTSGSIYLDDFSLEFVGTDASLSPLATTP